MAEADGNRTRQRQDLPLSDFEDRAGHQTGYASLGHGFIMANHTSNSFHWSPSARAWVGLPAS